MNLFIFIFNGKVFGKNIPSTLITVPTFTGIMNLQDHFLNEEGNSATKRILCAIASNFVEIDCCPVLVDLGKFKQNLIFKEEIQYLLFSSFSTNFIIIFT